MIDFKKECLQLSKLYDTDKEIIEIPDSHTEMRNYDFTSKFIPEYRNDKVVSGNLYYYELSQDKFSENIHFTYPVILPKQEEKFDRAILFFHGLNERSWDKYFVWAKYLAEKVGCPVIMFPIAYHINRCPKRWSDPRSMAEITALRSQQEKSSSFVNAALSTRLEKNPEKFLISGIQSYYDVLDLVKEIKVGNHPLFNADAHLDIFSYSIGAFLAEILVLNNFNNIFDNTKLFMFCGGTTFDSMNGISKYIMDETAFESIMSINNPKRLRRIRKGVINVPKLLRFRYNWSGIGLMMSTKERRRKREKKIRRYAHNIYALALEQDKVMPPKMISRTLKGKKGDIPTRVEVIDFPFNYSHELPFPINDDKIQPLVSRCFTVVFDKAVNFFI